MAKQQTAGQHGEMEGAGFIRVPKDGGTIFVEYRYNRTLDGEYAGSVSTWQHQTDGAGLVAYMSRALPSRKDVLAWIFEKAEKLAEV